MYNFYQSKIWTDLSKDVYKKKMFQEKLFGKEYTGVIREKKIGPITTRWFQIMGVVLPEDMKIVKTEVRRLKKKYNNKFGNILFQLGVMNTIATFPNIAKRSKSFKANIKDMRLSIYKLIKRTGGMTPSFKENMPDANIIYDITKSDEQLLDEMHSGSKVRVKKAMNKGATFRVADPSEYEQFYKDWKKLAGSKGFNIIPYDLYKKLIAYITKNNCGELFIVEIEKEMLAGSICIYDKSHVIYLYGFASREKQYRNVGAHHFLKFSIFGWGRAKGLTNFDMLGGAPTGFDNHPRAGVSRFKESLGGNKIEHYGSFDIILNPLLYRLFKWKQMWRNRKRLRIIKRNKKNRK